WRHRRSEPSYGRGRRGAAARHRTRPRSRRRHRGIAGAPQCPVRGGAVGARAVLDGIRDAARRGPGGGGDRGAAHPPRRSSGGPEGGVIMHLIQDVRDSLAQAPRIIEGLIAAAPGEALLWRESDGAWNAVEVLCHLADGEITGWMPRIERILSGGGRFTPFDREGGFLRHRGWTEEPLLGDFGHLRRANREKPATLNLPPPHRRLPGEPPNLGSVALAVLLACGATHDMAPVSQLSRLLPRSFAR